MKGWWGEKPNYLEYIGMEGGRGNEAQVCFQEWVQDKKWNYQRNLADDEDPSELEEPKTMLEQRMLDKERAGKHWQESFLCRLFRGDTDALEEKERNNERIRVKEQEWINEQIRLMGDIVNFQERTKEESGGTCLPSHIWLVSK